MASEFDETSPNYWLADRPVEKAVERINETFRHHQETILKEGKFIPGIPVGSDYHRLHKLVWKIKSDPFIPKPIRSIVVELLENRTQTLFESYVNVFGEYMNNLAKGDYINDLDGNKARVHNQINRICYERGCGISQVEEQVHRIRLILP